MNTYNLEDTLQKILCRVEKPARYIGGEPYMVTKKPGEYLIRLAFCFPDTYEIGMSWMGYQLLYSIMNKTYHTYMERVFAPAKDMEAEMRKENLPLYTLETKTPVRDADIVGFTLQYEMSYTNILNMLELAGIPLLAKDRDESYPLIVAGGPCAYNCEPLADFFDAVMVGDGEEQLPKFCETVAILKERGASKAELLQELSKIQGVYIPSYYEPVYDEKSNYTGYKVLNSVAPHRVTRAFLDDLNSVDYPTRNIVPLIEVVHDRAVCELFRGCTRGCRFCQAGMIYRPVRERDKDENERIAKAQLENSGHSELSLLSLSSSDYTGFEPLVTELMDYCKPRNIGISLPSLRLDNFSFKVLDEIQGVRKTGLTFAPEAGTQRLRDVINKNITEKDILSAMDKAMDLGWRAVKLYFMIGLPTETDEDLDGIIDIAAKIMQLAYQKNGRKGTFNVSISVANFVPKPFTPFQWCAQNTPEEFRRKHDYLKNKVRAYKGVTLHYHESYTSKLEAIFARGGRQLCKTLLRAHELGCSFDSWTEHFKENAWKQALDDTGIDDNYFALQNLKPGSPQPWDVIDCGIDDDYFLSEWNKAAAVSTTPDCRYGCNGCGINKHIECKWGGIYE